MQFGPRPLFAILLILFAGLVWPAGPGAAQDYHPERDLALIAERGLPDASVGFVVYDLESGARVLAHNADGLFPPASAIKLPVALAAMEVLGEDYRFETRLLMTGSINGGVLDGDLILVGGADPMLLTDDLVPFMERMQAMGIERVAGRFVFDDSYLAEEPVLQREHEQDVAYNPGIAGLALNFNRVQLTWQRAAQGNGFQIAEFAAVTDNFSHTLQYLNAGTTPRPRRPAFPIFVYEATASGGRWLLTNRVGRNGSFWLPVKHPGRYAAEVFRQLAADNEIALPEPVRGDAPEDAQLIHAHRSEPLPRIVHKMLYFSNNLVAETIGTTTVRAMTDQVLPIGAAATNLADWWRAQLPDADWNGMLWDNHSGLSERSRMSPEQLAAVVRYASQRRYEGQPIERFMRRFRHYRPRQALTRHAWVRGKTGTIDHVRALTGILQTNERRRYAFAVLIADARARDLYVAQHGNAEGYRRPAARAWNARARELLRDLVYRWMQDL